MEAYSSFSLGAKQVELLQRALNEAEASQATTGRYALAYEILFQMISVDTGSSILLSEDNLASVDINTVDLENYNMTYSEKFQSGVSVAPLVDLGAWIFLQGVSEVNWTPADNPDGTADTSFSEFIREYTKVQYLKRFGATETNTEVDAKVQEASDTIARNILSDILNQSVAGQPAANPENFIPTIFGIATNDAQAAVTGATGNDGLFSDGQIGGWSGSPFLLTAGHQEAYRRNILHDSSVGGDGDTGETYDILAMIFSLAQASVVLGFSEARHLITEVWNNVVEKVPGTDQLLLDILLDTEAYMEAAYGDNALLPFVDLYNSGPTDIILGTKENDSGTGNVFGSLSGTADNEILHAGSGDDTILGSGGNDIVDGGAGVDSVNYKNITDGLVVNIQNPMSERTTEFIGSVLKNDPILFPEFDTLYNIESIRGSNQDDEFIVKKMKDGLKLDGAGSDDLGNRLSVFSLPDSGDAGKIIIDANEGVLSYSGQMINCMSSDKVGQFSV